MAFFKDLLKKWFYQNSSSAASNDARIPLLTATGEPKGSDTMANIASALGASCSLGNVDTGSVNSKIQNGFYQHPGAIRTGGNWGVLFVYKGADNYIIQHDFEFTSDAYFIRYSTNGGSSWSGWHSVPTDIPSFYKNYADLSSLASALGGLKYYRVNSGAIVNVGNLKGTNGSTLIFINNGNSAKVIFAFVKDNNNYVTIHELVSSQWVGTVKDSDKYNNIYYENGSIYVQGKGGGGDCYIGIY